MNTTSRICTTVVVIAAFATACGTQTEPQARSAPEPVTQHVASVAGSDVPSERAKARAGQERAHAAQRARVSDASDRRQPTSVATGIPAGCHRQGHPTKGRIVCDPRGSQKFPDVAVP